MATSITVAAFQAALSACADAIAVRDWATAQASLAQAEVINAGLELEVDAHGPGGATVSRRESLLKTQQLIDGARATINQTNGEPRTIRGRIGFGYGRHRHGTGGCGW